MHKPHVHTMHDAKRWHTHILLYHLDDRTHFDRKISDSQIDGYAIIV